MCLLKINIKNIKAKSEISLREERQQKDANEVVFLCFLKAFEMFKLMQMIKLGEMRNASELRSVFFS